MTRWFVLTACSELLHVVWGDFNITEVFILNVGLSYHVSYSYLLFFPMKPVETSLIFHSHVL